MSCFFFIILILITTDSISIAANDNEAQDLKRIVVSPDPEDQKELEEFPNPVQALPEGPTGYQKVVRVFEGVKQANPGVYWYQIDSLKWIAETSYGNIPASNVEDGDKYAPVKTSVRDRIQMANNPAYIPDTYMDQTKRQVSSDVLIPSPHIAKVETTAYQGKNSLITKLELDPTKTIVTLTSETGKIDSKYYVKEYTKEYGKNPSGKTKYSTLYLTPLNITWRSKWTEQKKFGLQVRSV
ncbi:hypothetical protein [Paenibacillus xylanexedens]|uniref:hypothetical protein n=1 Tax=Paenibacillus xylanexedens TaxID=528191 RepID=UPI003D020545